MKETQDSNGGETHLNRAHEQFGEHIEPKFKLQTNPAHTTFVSVMKKVTTVICP